MVEAIGVMVDANILRYNVKGYLKWHSQVQQDEHGTELQKKKHMITEVFHLPHNRISHISACSCFSV